MALSGIRDQLIIAKSPSGDFYLPAFDYCNIDNLDENYGYQYKVSEDVELIYQLEEDDEEFRGLQPDPEHYSVKVGDNDVATLSAVNMSVLLIGESSLSGLEIGAFTESGRVVGSGCIDQDGRCGMAVWGDNPDTDEIEGATNLEMIDFRIWDGVSESDLTVTNLIGNSFWNADEFFVGKIVTIDSSPIEFGIIDCYPNPANGPVRLVFGLPESGAVSVRLFDINGRMIRTILDGQEKAGFSEVIWNTSDLSSGIYMVQLEMSQRKSISKIIVLK